MAKVAENAIEPWGCPQCGGATLKLCLCQACQVWHCPACNARESLCLRCQAPAAGENARRDRGERMVVPAGWDEALRK